MYNKGQIAVMFNVFLKVVFKTLNGRQYRGRSFIKLHFAPDSVVNAKATEEIRCVFDDI